MGNPLAVEENTALAQARAGSSAAFGALIDAYHDGLYRRALKMTQNQEDAEDVVQDAELKAYCRLDQFQGNSRFGTWMMRIVINEALMMLRKRRLNRETLGLDLSIMGEWKRGHPLRAWPIRSDSAFELKSLLNRAMDGLSPSLRSTFMLCYLEGYSPQEAASMLNLSVAGVKSRLLRARRRLHRRLITLLRPYGNEPDLGKT